MFYLHPSPPLPSPLLPSPSVSSQVCVVGNMVIEFTPEEKPRILMWYFQVQNHVEYISRSEAIQLVGHRRGGVAVVKGSRTADRPYWGRWSWYLMGVWWRQQPAVHLRHHVDIYIFMGSPSPSLTAGTRGRGYRFHNHGTHSCHLQVAGSKSRLVVLTNL